MQPEQKFKIGDFVRDIFNGNTGTVNAIFWSEGNEHNKPEWAYSYDDLGWRFVKESELELVQSGVPIWDAVKELTEGVEVDIDAPLEDK